MQLYLGQPDDIVFYLNMLIIKQGKTIVLEYYGKPSDSKAELPSGLKH